ncbi:MAG TPA: PDGLE domain-containing protein [Solirubrobacteraceae bacterium]|nr:PDGLE domain-containing protein [Solirubrobacteraceae bacterium]
MRAFAILALALAVGLAVAVSPFASSAPDGLERVATDHGFVDEQRQHGAPAPGYAFPGIDDPKLATGMAGFAGTLLVFGLGYGLAAVRRRPARA